MPEDGRRGGVAARADDARQLRQMALLIDCDNQTWKALDRITAAAAASSRLVIRRAYADWSNKEQFAEWEHACIENAIIPIHAPALNVAKNASDLALAVDAMEFSLTERINAVCIVSADADFVPVIQRLREHDIYVLGLSTGEKTSRAFRQACDDFLFIDPQVEDTRESDVPATLPDWWPLLMNVCEYSQRDDEWVHLGWAGAHMRRLRPDFDPIRYGHRGLRNLIATQPESFEIEERVASPDHPPAPWIRPTEKAWRTYEDSTQGVTA